VKDRRRSQRSWLSEGDLESYFLQKHSLLIASQIKDINHDLWRAHNPEYGDSALIY